AALRHGGRTVAVLAGGLGVPYEELHAPYENATANTPQPADLGKLVHEYFGDLGCTMIVEPGRAIVANAGVLVTQVMYIKKTAHKNFIIVDAAMNDLIRPTLYEAYHEIWPVMKNDAAQKNLADVVGPVCETGDFLAQDRMMPDVQAGDFLAVMSAGAYGAVMAGTYNTRPLVPEVMVKGGDWAIIRPRQTVDALIGLDRMPGWLDQG
ncbi:MAG: diaminopimelate decarboxylase, partial [Alphaproteobacteria bacterium]|nr:diaminopimelate decarboxylase [Alphaproteobacteria bacterium]